MKGLGDARRIDESFQLLESVEQGTAVGSPTLSAPLIYGLLNALVETGKYISHYVPLKRTLLFFRLKVCMLTTGLKLYLQSHFL